MKEIASGAEAKIFVSGKLVVKKRVSKSYRNPVLDQKIIKTRNKQESSLLNKARDFGINTPLVYSVTVDTITMEKLNNTNQHKNLLTDIGKEIAKLHNNEIIHGDLNLINIITTEDQKIYFIDFGLGYLSNKIENKATDLLVLKKTLKANKKTEKYWEKILSGYQKQTNNPQIIKQIEEIEKRARYL